MPTAAGEKPTALAPRNVFFILVAWVFVAGCSQHGNFSSFIVQEVASYGGHTKTNASLPALDAHWKVQRDKDGFEAVVTGTSFSSADAVMRRAFGTPMPSGNTNESGVRLPSSNWAARDIGVAILAVGYSNRVQINCIRGVQNMGELIGGHNP